MSRDEHHTDQLFREGIGEYASSVSPDMFARIQQARSSRKKMPFFFLPLSISMGIALLSILIISYWIFTNHQKRISPLSTPPTAKVENNNSSKIAFDTQSIEIKTSKSIRENKVEENLSTAFSIITKKKKNNFKKTASSNASNFKKANSNENRDEQLLTTNQLNDDYEFLEITSFNNDNSHSQGASLRKKAQVKSNLAAEEKWEPSNTSLTLPTPKIDFLSSSVPLLSLQNDLSFVKPPRLKKSEKAPRGCYSFVGGWIRYDYYVDAYLSVGNRFIERSAKEEEYRYYEDSRAASEKTLYTFGGGMRIGVVTRGGWAVRTGISYQRSLEKFQIDEENSSQTIIVIDNITGDTTITSQTGRAIKTTYNRYHEVNIPALVGYEFELHKFAVNVNAGININLLAKATGEILNTNNLPAFLGRNPARSIHAYKQKLGIGILASMAFNYKLKPDLHLLLEPQLLYPLQSASLASYPLAQKNTDLQLLIGLRKRF